MSDEFEFRMSENEISEVDNSNSWGSVAAFVADHPHVIGCGRPTYVRVTVGYSAKLMAALGEDTTLGKIVTAIYRVFPALIGSKAIMCAQCSNVVFISPFMQWLWLHLAMDDTVNLLVFHEDTRNIPSERKEEFFS